MDRTLRLQALVAPLRDDVLSGAADIARVAVDTVRRAALESPAGDVLELRRELGEVGQAILDAQPVMAPLVALVAAILDAAGAASDLEGGREAVLGAAQAFRTDLGSRTARVATRAAALLPAPEQGPVLTLSSSSTVREALLANDDRGALEVTVLESRPMQEGRILAAALARAGVPVTLAVDAAASTLVRRSSMVLLGADSVGDAGVVNKVGSLAVASAARAAGVPVLVLTDETKILPVGFPQHLGSQRPAREVWQAPAGVRVWNQYFEAVPLDAVTSVVAESATMTPLEVEEYRRRIRLPEEVRAWAARHH